MQTLPAVPTPEDVARICRIQDPRIRNLQITQCYHELSAALAARTGLEANWCTFATWASKQAGQTIRKEDLARLLERLLRQSLTARQASRQVAAAVNIQANRQILGSPETLLDARSFTTAVDRASDAAGRGNKKVFEEIADAFARFYHTCLMDEPDPGGQRLAAFCESLRPGDPPEGQGYLRRAFMHYARALAESDPKTRAELLLMANIEIGFHEQTRLQPEIAESLDAGLVSFLDFSRGLFRGLHPLKRWIQLAYLCLMRLLGRPTLLDQAVRSLLAEVRSLLRHMITEMMMTISLPSGEVLRLREDLKVGFPEPLRQITNPELLELLRAHDRTPDSTGGSGAWDWADLPERLHFILDLFRCYQQRPVLFAPPFTPEQVAALKAGRVPEGRL